jgi:hypothetical protein
MPNILKPKRSSTASSVPTTSNLADGELAVNTADQKIYVRSGASIVTVGSVGGTTHFLETENITSPNATVPVDAFVATDASYTNIDVALVAKGTGATLAQIPDGTTTGGNKRGVGATDLQKSRSANTQVASGSNAVILGGINNTSNSGSSFVGGGESNTASGSAAFVGGGVSNSASSSRSVVVGGAENNCSAGWSFLGGGQNNTVSGQLAVVAGGFFNTANGYASFIGGGTYGSTRSIRGNHVFPACDSPIASALGVTQSAILLLGRQTTDATATVLSSNNLAASNTNQVALPNNSAYFFKGSVIAGVTGGGNTKAWEFKGAIKRGANAAATSIVGSVINDVIASDAGASTWDITITADTTNGAIAVTVTGAASTTIRWVCKIETTEMVY